MSVQIFLEHPGTPDVLGLLAQSDAFMAGLYPPESNHMLDAAALSRPHVRFFVARGVLADPERGKTSQFRLRPAQPPGHGCQAGSGNAPGGDGHAGVAAEYAHTVPETAGAGFGIGSGGHPGGPALGCGALVLDGGGSAEIKRLFVGEAARGRGLGRLLLQRLEACAVQEGVHTLRLETGIYQPQALGLYQSSGYARRGPFGAYQPDPFSVFMEKRLAG